jgi:capsular exopolysaccharide synthesis family protein
LPSEGKSSTASSLAQIAARYGQRVVIVDCDLRRPTLHRLWASPAAPGLAEFLLHQKELNEVIHTEHPSGAHLIPAGTLPEMPPNLLSSSQFRSMLHNLKNYYDLVILDSAPVLSIADTKVLAALADRTVLIVHWATTPLRVVSSTIDSLMNAGANIAGVVLTRVNVKSHARDGFSDSVLYAGRLQKYYQ